MARGLVNQPWRPDDTITVGMLRSVTRELVSQFKMRAAAPANRSYSSSPVLQILGNRNRRRDRPADSTFWPQSRVKNQGIRDDAIEGLRL